MISNLKISGFRGIPANVELDLGRVTLLAGRNGLGKTTIFDAIDWCLFGSAWRLGYEQQAIRNLYNPACRPSVSLTLTLHDKSVTIERTEGGVALDGRALTERDLINELVTDLDVFGPYARDVQARLRQMVYLPQAEIRSIVSPDNNAEREALFQSLLGVPNAALLQSGVRRVGDRFSARKQRLEERLRDLKHRMDTISRTMHAAEPIEEKERQQIAADIVRLANLQNAEGTNTEELLSLARSHLQELFASRVSLEGFGALVSQTIGNLQSSRNEIAETKAAIERLALSLANERHSLEEATALRDTAAKDLKAADDEISKTTARIDHLTSMRLRAEELARAKEEAENVTAAVESFERSVKEAKERLNRTQESLSQEQLSLDTERASLEAAEGYARRVAQSQNIRNRRDAFLKELTNRTDESRRLVQEIARQDADLLTARNDFAKLDNEHKHAESSASTQQRFRALVTQLATLAAELKMTSCPLCGQDYGTVKNLSDHIAQTDSVRAKDDETLVQLSTTLEITKSGLQDAEHKRSELNTRLQAEERETEKISEQLDSLAREEEALGEVSASAPSGVGSQELRLRIQAHESSLGSFRALLADAEADLRAAESRLLTERQRLAAARARVERLSAVSEGQDEQPEKITERMREAEDTIKAQQSQRLQIEHTYQARVSHYEKQSYQYHEAEIALERHRGRLVQAAQRLESLERDIREQAKKVDLNPDSKRLAEDVSERVRTLADAATELQRAVEKLEQLVAAERYRAADLEIRALEKQKIAVDRELDEISVAQTRFAELTHLIEETSTAEARKASRHLREAIQECFTGLYPHNHLDQIRLSASDVLLFDSDLRDPVQPYFYTSTGQLNVLALALFMGVALRQQVCQLGFVMLDEPVQNLADIQFLAFMLFVKRVALSRQVIISTADNNIAELFRRQMISGHWSKDGRQYMHYEWRSFDPWSGPKFVPVSADSTLPRTRPVDTASA